MRDPRSILITGASSGIGEALATAYAGPGVTLFLGGRDHDRLAAVAEACRRQGAEVDTGTIDVRDAAAMRQWVLKADEQRALDLVIANAGISMGFDDARPIGDVVSQIFDINVAGVFNTVHPALERMRPRRRGRLAIMSSLAGFRGLPGAAAYSASKAALRSYGEGLRGYLHGEGVGVSVICPGFVQSRMTAVNPYPMPLLMDAPRAARIIQRGLARNQGRIAFPAPMYAMAWLLMALPAAWTDALVRWFPSKR